VRLYSSTSPAQPLPVFSNDLEILGKIRGKIDAAAGQQPVAQYVEKIRGYYAPPAVFWFCGQGSGNRYERPAPTRAAHRRYKIIGLGAQQPPHCRDGLPAPLFHKAEKFICPLNTDIIGARIIPAAADYKPALA